MTSIVKERLLNPTQNKNPVLEAKKRKLPVDSEKNTMKTYCIITLLSAAVLSPPLQAEPKTLLVNENTTFCDKIRTLYGKTDKSCTDAAVHAAGQDSAAVNIQNQVLFKRYGGALPAAPSITPPAEPDAAPAPRQPSSPPVPQAPSQTSPSSYDNLAWNINFTYNSAALDDAARHIIDKEMAPLLLYDNTARFIVEGHTDSKGAARYNQILSERRAQAVKGYLLSHYDIAAGRLQAAGRGESDPIVPDTADPKNRRVQLRPLR